MNTQPSEGTECYAIHECTCGAYSGDDSPHLLGISNCANTLCDAPLRAPDRDGMRFWWTSAMDDNPHGPVTEYTLMFQRGFQQHPCGCWSCFKRKREP